MFKKMFKKIALVACVASLAVGTIAVANAGSYNAEFGAFFNDPDPANDSDDGGWLNLGDAAKTTFTDDGSVATITVELAEERSFEGNYAAAISFDASGNITLRNIINKASIKGKELAGGTECEEG